MTPHPLGLGVFAGNLSVRTKDLSRKSAKTQRSSREGQSLLLAVNKCLGTLAPTIQFGIIGDLGFPRGSLLVFVAGLFCFIFDVIYIWMLQQPRLSQNNFT